MNAALKEIIPLIIGWYETNKKDLPWRRDADPYAIWISEIMLQQTRIEAVIPYYHRFLCELPDITALAAVDDDRLMKLWEGLGYYSRARNLKKAASVIVSEYGGSLPKRAEELRTLPGIGEYTAGAIASIAFGEPEPAVDGNVLRVISRITASDKDIALMTTKREISHALRAVYPTGSEAGMLTEGLMELGEAVCIPNGVPLCDPMPRPREVPCLSDRYRGSVSCEKREKSPSGGKNDGVFDSKRSGWHLWSEKTSNVGASCRYVGVPKCKRAFE